MAQSNPPDEDQDESPTKDALYQRATELRIVGRRKMNRDDLEDAVRKAEKALAGKAEAEPAPPAAAEPASSEEAAKEATPEQARKISGASNEQLEGLVGDPALAPHLRKLVVQEIGKRTEAAKTAAAQHQARGRMDRYRVTKGGQYISKDQFITRLEVGAVLTSTSHDLEHVRRQGIEFEPAVSVTIGQDQLGNQVTQVR